MHNTWCAALAWSHCPMQCHGSEVAVLSASRVRLLVVARFAGALDPTSNTMCLLFMATFLGGALCYLFWSSDGKHLSSICAALELP